MRAKSKMSARIIDENTEEEVYYSTAFCFCWHIKCVLLPLYGKMVLQRNNKLR